MAGEERYELGDISQVSAVSIGVPGQRTFFLILGQPGEWVRAWLEKEMLEALALGAEQFLASLAQEHLYEPPETEPEDVTDDAPAGLPTIELEIDQISLGFDKEKVTLDLMVHVLGPETEGQSELSCRVTPEQLKRLGLQAVKICAAGRPRCPLCGGPIDPEGHICPKTN